VLNDKLVFTAGGTRDATRFVAYDLRTALENEFTGLKGTLSNVTNVRTFTANKMTEYKNNNIIVDSFEPDTGNFNPLGWRNLRVFLNGDVVTVRIEIFVVTEIAFQLNDINLQIARLSV